MARLLMTMHEDRPATRPDHFAVLYRIDEYDCFEITAGLAELGHETCFVNWDDLEGERFGRMFHWNERRFIEPLPLAAFDLLVLYKMEGFYFDLPRFLALVALFESTGLPVLNHPATMRHNLDKRYLLALAERGVAVIPTRELAGAGGDAVRRRLAAGEPFVLKPIFGERGRDVVRVRSVAELEAAVAASGLAAEDLLVQDFVPSVRAGERGLVYVGHEFLHAVLKTPNPDDPQEFRCNESQGGTVTPYEPTPEELAFAGRVLAAYESLGCPVHYSRVDLLATPDGPVLMEAELINPGIFINYVGRGPELGRRVAAYLDRLLAAR